jgi:hypothetical protein
MTVRDDSGKNRRSGESRNPFLGIGKKVDPGSSPG